MAVLIGPTVINQRSLNPSAQVTDRLIKGRSVQQRSLDRVQCLGLPIESQAGIIFSCRQDIDITHNTVYAIILYTLIHITRKEGYLPSGEIAVKRKESDIT